jgi:hypothetical protein
LLKEQHGRQIKKRKQNTDGDVVNETRLSSFSPLRSEPIVMSSSLLLALIDITRKTFSAQP